MAQKNQVIGVEKNIETLCPEINNACRKFTSRSGDRMNPIIIVAGE